MEKKSLTFDCYQDGASCKSRDFEVAATIDGFVEIPRENERALQEALALHGPVVVAIDAGLDSFRFYRSGTFNKTIND